MDSSQQGESPKKVRSHFPIIKVKLILEHIVLTPKKKTQRSTTLMMERKQVLVNQTSTPGNVHVAGGTNAGIIVNKQQIGDEGNRSPNSLYWFNL